MRLLPQYQVAKNLRWNDLENEGPGAEITFVTNIAPPELEPTIANVNFADFSILAASFGQEGTWMNGDFDGNGQVAFGDFLLLANNFGFGEGI